MLKRIIQEVEMGYEVDFLHVGEKSNSGDAILLHFGDGDNLSDWNVVLIDGGFSADGEKIVSKVEEYYKKDKIDLVISTHPDQDHINGLSYVIENIEVGELWIHKPWEHNQTIFNNVVDGRHTEKSIGEKLKQVVSKAHNLVEIAETKGIEVKEPFTGLNAFNGKIKILGPTKEYYHTLISDFDGMPGAKKRDEFLAKSLSDKVLDAYRKISQLWGEDGLPTEDKTSAKNNTSAITQLIVDNRRLLLTGDAGITGLGFAVDELENCSNSAELKFLQLPHHGSKRNISSELLDRLLGTHVEEGTNETTNITTFASTAKEGHPKHPSKRVLNAVVSRGARAVITGGVSARHYYQAPERDNWQKATSHKFEYSYDE